MYLEGRRGRRSKKADGSKRKEMERVDARMRDVVDEVEVLSFVQGKQATAIVPTACKFRTSTTPAPRTKLEKTTHTVNAWCERGLSATSGAYFGS